MHIRASGIQSASAIRPKKKPIIAATTAHTGWHPNYFVHMYKPLAACIGTKKTSQNGYSKIQRSTKPIILRILQQGLL